MSSLNEIKNEIELYGKNKKISVLFVNIEDNSVVLHKNEDMIVNSASTIKTAILMAVLDRVKTGKLSLNQEVSLCDSSFKNYTKIYTEIHHTPTLSELLTFMIITSDNAATNAVIDLVGFEYLNSYFKKMGLVSTVLGRYMGKENVEENNHENFTSNIDMLNMYKKIYFKQITTKKLCNLALEILRMQRNKNASQRYIFENIEVYHKTGGLKYLGLRNDCGIFIKNKKAYYFGIFVENDKSDEHASMFIGKIFKEVYSAL